MIPKIPEKTFFKIGEVANLVGVKTHVIRYWESEFRRIRTSKTKTGQRLFQRREIFYLTAIRVLIHDHKFTVAGARDRLDELISQYRDPEAVLKAVVGSAIAPAEDNASSGLSEPTPPPPTLLDLVSASPSRENSESTLTLVPTAREEVAQLAFDSLDGVDEMEYAADSNELFGGQRADLVARILALESELGSTLSERAQLIIRLEGATEALEDTRAELATQTVRLTQSEDSMNGEIRRLRDQLSAAHQGLRQERTKGEALFAELEDSRARLAQKAAHRIVLEARILEADEALAAARKEADVAAALREEVEALRLKALERDAIALRLEDEAHARSAAEASLQAALAEIEQFKAMAQAAEAERNDLKVRLAAEEAARTALTLDEDAWQALLDEESQSKATLNDQLEESRKLQATLREEMRAVEASANELRREILAQAEELEFAKLQLEEEVAAKSALEARLDEEISAKSVLEARLDEEISAKLALQQRFEERAALYINAQGQMMALTQRTEELEEELSKVRAQLDASASDALTLSEELEFAKLQLEEEASAKSALEARLEEETSAKSALQQRFEERAALYIDAQGQMMALTQRTEEFEEELSKVRAQLEESLSSALELSQKLSSERASAEELRELLELEISESSILRQDLESAKFEASRLRAVIDERVAEFTLLEAQASDLRDSLQLTEEELQAAIAQMEAERQARTAAQAELADHKRRFEKQAAEERAAFEQLIEEALSTASAERKELADRHRNELERELERNAELSADILELQSKLEIANREQRAMSADHDRELMVLQRHIFDEKQRVHRNETAIRSVIEKIRQRQLAIARVTEGKR